MTFTILYTLISCTYTYRRKFSDLVQQKGTSHAEGRLHWGGVKDFVDGSLGSRTALMHQPYTDDPTTSGVRLTDQKALKQLMTEAHQAGLQVVLDTC